MESLGIVIAVIGFILFVSGRASGNNGLQTFGKGLLIAGILIAAFFFFVEIRFTLTPVTDNLEPVPKP